MKIKQRGFTLLELLVVLLIIGMLVAYVGPKYFGEVGKSQRQVAAAQIEGIGQALDQFRVDTNHYPTMTEGLAALYSAPGTSSEPNWNGPYLKKPVPPDPWGNAYVYTIPSATQGKDYDLISYGSDGQAGGTGDAADITN
ncbi:MAG: type II secretion system major pseudopilin GspG [Burkholderiaceae bacterium]|nr:type II secretion system major pseudopilin GspG [Burkholderiaceae bacterium]